MGRLWKNVITVFGILGLVGVMGCATRKTMDDTNYLLCNDTSSADMAEIESGFFYLHGNIVYYADKEDLTNWVPVCNKADCFHINKTCNAYVNSEEIAQKGEKLYYADMGSDNTVCVYELSNDGSGSKKVYEIPIEGTVNMLISSHSLLINSIFLREDGLMQRNIARLEEDGTLYHLYSETTKSQGTGLFVSSSSLGIRGNRAYISEALTLKYTSKTGIDVQKVLWRLDEEQPELINLSDDIAFSNSYLTENSLIDYETNRGFYKIDLETGKETLLYESQLENGRGYPLTEDYLVESNRYLNYASEDAQVKIYNGKTWLDIELPDVVTKLEETAFFPAAISTDRIFFKQEANGDEGYSCRFYYVMLNEKTPKLTYCATFGSDGYFDVANFEQSEEASSSNDESEWQKLDNIIFDTEEYLIKVTGVGLSPEHKEQGEEIYKITMHCENKTSDKNFSFRLQDCAINGVMSLIGANCSLKAGETKEHVIYVDETFCSVYKLDEYTDIEFFIYDSSNKKTQKVFHVYPQGEENVISHVREAQPTDQVLIDNEYITVTIIGYDTNSIENDTVKLLIENKSDTNIGWSRHSYPNINGIEAKQYKQVENEKVPLYSKDFIKKVLPHCCAYVSLELPSEFLEENNVTSIENWDVILQVWYGETWNQELVNEMYTITP